MIRTTRLRGFINLKNKQANGFGHHGLPAVAIKPMSQDIIMMIKLTIYQTNMSNKNLGICMINGVNRALNKENFARS